MRTYEMQTIVTFADTNVVGNVYYTRHLEWQGRCRELFLREHAPTILDELRRGLVLATTRCSCEYFAELFPFDEVMVRMHLAELAQNRVTMGFEYFRTKPDGPDELVARGEQQIVTLRRVEGSHAGTEPTPVPEALRRGLEPFRRS